MKEIKTLSGVINYEITYKRIKRINFRAKPDGVLYISAPVGVSERYIQKIISENCEKMKKGIDDIVSADKAKSEKEAEAEKYFYYLGKKYPVKHIKSNERKAYFSEEGVKVFAPDELTAKTALKDLSVSLAKKVFAEAYDEIFPLIPKDKGKIPPKIKITIKEMKTRWGSCTPDNGHISLNLALIKYPYGCTRYVLLHEFAHFFHRNHSKDFYAFVEKYMRDYKNYEGILKKPYYEVTL
ncbi:MAG: M48 family metallopeptidase [Clostridiales bacterium]|nr:M48 family metallopeptidase [Clostridiales bacterium]